MFNLLIQALTLLSGLVVNFVIPGLYGLEAYGAFIKANVLVFLFQKLLDIINGTTHCQRGGRVHTRHLTVYGGVDFSTFQRDESYR